MPARTAGRGRAASRSRRCVGAGLPRGAAGPTSSSPLAGSCPPVKGCAFAASPPLACYCAEARVCSAYCTIPSRAYSGAQPGISRVSAEYHWVSGGYRLLLTVFRGYHWMGIRYHCMHAVQWYPAGHHGMDATGSRPSFRTYLIGHYYYQVVSSVRRMRIGRALLFSRHTSA